MSPYIIKLRTKLRRMAIFTPRPLYPQGRFTDSHWMGYMVGPRPAWNTAMKIPDNFLPHFHH